MKKHVLNLCLILLTLVISIVGLTSCQEKDSGEDPAGSINKYYRLIDGESVEVSLGDVITLPTEPDGRIGEGYEFIGWEIGKQMFKPGESITLESWMFSSSGGYNDAENIIYTYYLNCNPVSQEIVRPIYVHYFDNMVLEYDSAIPLVNELTDHSRPSFICRDSADVSIEWKNGNHFDYEWLFLDKYDFEGWYLDEEYTKEFWDFSDLKAFGIGDEVHLYAKWTYTGIVYEELGGNELCISEIDLSDDIEKVVIPAEYGRGKKCNSESAGYNVVRISEDAFKGMGTIGTLDISNNSNIDLLLGVSFANVSIDCIALGNTYIPSTEVFDGYTGTLVCSADSDYDFIDGILYEESTNKILWVSNNIPKEIRIPEGIESIYKLFAGTNIEKIVLPDSVSSIEDGAFKDCVNLKTVEVSGDTLISDGAFSGCISLEYETYKGGKYIGNVLMGIEEGAILLEVKDGCANVPDNIMENNVTVTKVILPSTVTSIGYEAFKNSAIEEITIYGKGFYFAYAAFENCRALKTVTLPETVRYIGSNCFKDCVSLKSIDLSCLVSDDPTIISIDSSAFYGCTSLTTVTLPRSENITKLYSYTFYGCSELQNIVIPDNIVEIESACFKGCSSLNSVTMPSVSILGENCFNGCSSLENIELSNTVTALPQNCFRDCTSLASLSMPGVTTLGENCFSGCSELEGVELPEVTEIPANCFSGCTALDYVVLSVDVDVIAKDSFNNCLELEYVFYLGNEYQWNYDVDNKCPAIEDKVYFYSAEVQTVEEFIETRKVYWGYDENNNPTVWNIETNRTNGKTYYMSSIVSVAVSDDYWDMVLSLKASGNLSQIAASDEALYNAMNTSTTKEQFEEALKTYYLNKFNGGFVSLQDGVMTNEASSRFTYVEVNGEVLHVFQLDDRTFRIVSDNQIEETYTSQMNNDDAIIIKCLYTATEG